MKKKTDKEVIETEDDLEMFKRSHLWHDGMFLTIKKKDESEIGIIFFMDKTTVILDNLFLYQMKTDSEKLNLEKIKYPSIEALLADGWIVD